MPKGKPKPNLNVSYEHRIALESIEEQPGFVLDGRIRNKLMRTGMIAQDSYDHSKTMWRYRITQTGRDALALYRSFLKGLNDANG